MKKKILRNLNLVLVLTTLSLFISYYFLFNFIKEKNIVIANAALDSEMKAKQLASGESVQKVIEDSQMEILAIENYFVGQDGVVDFIEYLESLATALEVSISIQDVQEKETSETYPDKAELHFKIAVQGSWDAVYRFLAGLEEMPYGVKIGYADLKKNSGGQTLPASSDTLVVPGTKTVEAKSGAWQGDFEFTVLKHK